MRIYINTAVVQDTANLVVDELVQAGIVSYTEGEEAKKIETVEHLSNFSVDIVPALPGRPGHIVIEINDEVFYKLAKSYRRAIRFIAPLLKPAKAFFAAFDEDVKDVEEFLIRRK